MNKGMPRSTSLDFSKTNQISAFEVSVAVFELPERRVRGSGVENVAHCTWVSINV